ncbi:MAG: TAXI family TRAP transporter solute-binding subunit [Desulfobacterales bacterium]|nr:TAXI family TRAP transporter solute-binding subunit [Desulfobacterales bacterium]
MKKSSLFFTVFIILFSAGNSSAKTYKFSGGPSGGTYQYYAGAIANLASQAGIKVKAEPSGGSIANIRLVSMGKADFAVSYSGDIFRAGNGMLAKDRRKYTNVFAIGRFYGAPAQLVVRGDSNITSAGQLTGKRVGVGNFGSGAAGNCELFFTEMGIWYAVDKEFLGYDNAAQAFNNRKIDAFWLFTGFPNSSVKKVAAQNKITLLNIYNDAEKAGMFKKYPYFSKITIPARTYKGVNSDTVTFQDSALWTVNKKVSEADVYKLLKTVYSNEGLEYMVKTHKSAKGMSIKNGISGIVTPLHPGAEKFWREKGILK